MWAHVSPELTIIARAQQTVDRWRRADGRQSFDEAIAIAAKDFWGDQFDSRSIREAFGIVAEAIRRGDGHGFQNREPLIAILRERFPQDRSA